MTLTLLKRFVKANYRKTLSSTLGFAYIIVLILLCQIFVNVAAVYRVNNIIATTLISQSEVSLKAEGTPYLSEYKIDMWLSDYASLKEENIEINDCLVGLLPLSLSNETIDLIYLYFIPISIYYSFGINITGDKVLMSPLLSEELEINGSSENIYYSVAINDEDYSLNLETNFSLTSTVSDNLNSIYNYLSELKVEVLSLRSLFLPWEVLIQEHKNNVFKRYLHQIGYYGIFNKKLITIFQRIDKFVAERRENTENIFTHFNNLINFGEAIEIRTPLLDSLEDFINNDYKKGLRITLILLIPIFLGLFLYQFQDIEMLRTNWYNYVLNKKMRGASFFQQFAEILFLYVIVNLGIFVFVTLIFLSSAVIFHDLFSWLKTFFVLSVLGFILSSSVQGLGIFRLISEIYRRTILISKEGNNIIIHSSTKFEKWREIKKKKTFLVFFVLLILVATFTEILNYYFISQSAEPDSVFLLFTLPRISYLIFLTIIIFSYIWQNLIYQFLTLSAKFLTHKWQEVTFIKHYWIRSMKKNKFFVFFTVLVVISFFATFSFADTLSNTYNAKRNFLFPYDMMIKLPRNVNNNTRNIICDMPEIEQFTTLYLTTPDFYYGSSRYLSLIVIDAKNYSSYINGFKVTKILKEKNNVLEQLLKENASCIVSEHIEYNVGDKYIFGMLDNEKLNYIYGKIIAKTNNVQGIGAIATDDETGIHWLLTDYHSFMNSFTFLSKANIIFIKLKEKSNIDSLINNIISRTGLDKKQIELQPTLEEKGKIEYALWDFQSSLNLESNTYFVTFFVFAAYFTLMITGTFMIVNENKPQIKRSAELLNSRGVDKNLVEKIHWLLFWIFFALLETISFIIGITLGLISATIVMVPNLLFFSPKISLGTLSVFIMLIIISVMIGTKGDILKNLRKIKLKRTTDE